MANQPSHAGVTLAIPGPWESQSELVKNVAQHNDGAALFAGMILFDVARKRHAELGWFERDAELPAAMARGSGGAIDDQVRAILDGHRGVAVLRLTETDHDGFAERLAFYTSAMRNAGGLGVHNEAAGVAHPWDRWESLIGEGNPHSLYRALMVHVPTSREKLSSFGMKQLGLPDTEVPHDDGGGEAAMTLQTFNVYQWVERPTFKDGQTFSVAADAPRFQLQKMDDERYDPGHHYLNPHGIWQLTWADDDA